MSQGSRKRLVRRGPLPGDLDKFQIRELPVTACWAEYDLALLYLTSYGTGKLAKPDRGDQVDFCHTSHAGFSDVFVMGDRRMKYVLQEMVPSRTTKVYDRDE